LRDDRRRESTRVALDDIYKEVILDHYKNPRNKRELPGAELSGHQNNPLCGDEITVFVQAQDGSVSDVAFEGAGCSISQSSASMMTEAVQGRPITDARKLASDFRGMMAGDVEPDEDEFGDLVALKGVVKYPIRIKCAVLAWDVLQEALEGADGAASGAAPHAVQS
jgi:nitrogen fixation protein NifU and related proteins